MASCWPPLRVPSACCVPSCCDVSRETVSAFGDGRACVPTGRCHRSFAAAAAAALLLAPMLRPTQEKKALGVAGADERNRCAFAALAREPIGIGWITNELASLRRCGHKQTREKGEGQRKQQACSPLSRHGCAQQDTAAGFEVGLSVGEHEQGRALGTRAKQAAVQCGARTEVDGRQKSVWCQGEPGAREREREKEGKAGTAQRTRGADAHEIGRGRDCGSRKTKNNARLSDQGMEAIIKAEDKREGGEKLTRGEVKIDERSCEAMVGTWRPSHGEWQWNSTTLAVCIRKTMGRGGKAGIDKERA